MDHSERATSLGQCSLQAQHSAAAAIQLGDSAPPHCSRLANRCGCTGVKAGTRQGQQGPAQGSSSSSSQPNHPSQRIEQSVAVGAAMENSSVSFQAGSPSPTKVRPAGHAAVDSPPGGDGWKLKAHGGSRIPKPQDLPGTPVDTAKSNVRGAGRWGLHPPPLPPLAAPPDAPRRLRHLPCPPIPRRLPIPTPRRAAPPRRCPRPARRACARRR